MTNPASVSPPPGDLPGSAPRIGVALGSGASRGLAHIGVMRALDEAGVEVSCIAGTSMGAFVGSVYASGTLAKLEADFRKFDWRSIAALLDPVFPRSGLIDGRKIATFLDRYVSHRRMEDLPRRFRAVATDLSTGAETVIESGAVIDAVRASIAVPGLLTPLALSGRVLVDGGLVNPVPVSVARAMGADIVIGVDVSYEVLRNRLDRIHETATATRSGRLHEVLQNIDSPAALQLDAWMHRSTLPGVVDVLMSSIYVMQGHIARDNLQYHPPDLLIRPALGEIRFMDFDRAIEIIELGYRAAQEALATWVRPAPQ